MRNRWQLSELLRYLVSEVTPGDGTQRVPTLSQLSSTLGISISRLREQLEVARVLGLVDVRPRTGIRRLPYSFLPAVRQSLSYAVELDRSYFDQFSDLRNHVEAAYWHQAVRLLTEEDHAHLEALIASAWQKLRGVPIRIPHREHRELHLSVYRRLENPFVLGILEGYWEAYEAVGLNLYADYPYLNRVWQYHQAMVDGIVSGDFEAGYRALIEHIDLLYHRPPQAVLDEDDSWEIVPDTIH